MLGRTVNGANKKKKYKKQENTWIRSKRMSKNIEERWIWNIIQGTESTHNLFSYEVQEQQPQE